MWLASRHCRARILASSPHHPHQSLLSLVQPSDHHSDSARTHRIKTNHECGLIMPSYHHTIIIIVIIIIILFVIVAVIIIIVIIIIIIAQFTQVCKQGVLNRGTAQKILKFRITKFAQSSGRVNERHCACLGAAGVLPKQPNQTRDHEQLIIPCENVSAATSSAGFDDASGFDKWRCPDN